MALLKRCQAFKDNLESCQLIDLGESGPSYTWRGPIYRGGQQIYERLDRSISNEKWRLQFQDAHVKILTRVRIFGSSSNYDIS